MAFILIIGWKCDLTPTNQTFFFQLAAEKKSQISDNHWHEKTGVIKGKKTGTYFCLWTFSFSLGRAGWGLLVPAEYLTFLLLFCFLGKAGSPANRRPSRYHSDLSLRSTPTAPAPVVLNHSASCRTLLALASHWKTNHIFQRHRRWTSQRERADAVCLQSSWSRWGANSIRQTQQEALEKLIFVLFFPPATINMVVQVKHTDT